MHKVGGTVITRFQEVGKCRLIMRRKNQSIETDPELIEMLELTEKALKLYYDCIPKVQQANQRNGKYLETQNRMFLG